jgi:hypothetical protein
MLTVLFVCDSTSAPHAHGTSRGRIMIDVAVRLTDMACEQDRRGHESLGIVHTELKLHQHAVNDFAAAIK